MVLTFCVLYKIIVQNYRHCEVRSNPELFET